MAAKELSINLTVYAESEEELVKASESMSRALVGLALDGIEGNLRISDLSKVVDDD